MSFEGTYEVGVKVPYGKAELYVKGAEDSNDDQLVVTREIETQAESLREELFWEALEALAKRLGVSLEEIQKVYEAKITDHADALSTVNIMLTKL